MTFSSLVSEIEKPNEKQMSDHRTSRQITVMDSFNMKYFFVNFDFRTELGAINE